MGTFLLLISSPETLSWIGFAVLGVALVGEAGIYVIPAKWDKLHKEVAFGLALLAAVGYAVERVGDDAIIEALKHRATAAESRFSPRPLMANEIAAFADRLKQFSGTKFDVVIAWDQDPEIASVAVSLVKCLAKAGWTQIPWQGRGSLMTLKWAGGNDVMVGVDTQANGIKAPFVGIAVQGQPPKAAEALSTALKEAGRSVADDPGLWAAIDAWMPNMNANAVHVLVGRKL